MFRLNRIIVLTISIVIILGCNLSADNNRSSDSKNSAELEVTIPSISSVAFDMLNSVYSVSEKDDDISSSRAYYTADKIVFEVYSGTTLYHTETVEEDSDGDIKATLLLEEGTYTLSVECYNYNVSETEPVTSGTSEEFAITSGYTTSLDMVLLPHSPISIAEDEAVSITSFTSIDPYYYNDYYDYGSEHWYTLTTTTDVTSIIVDSEIYGGNAAYLLLYNSSGEYITENTYYGDLVFDSSTNTTYYLCVIPALYGLEDEGNYSFVELDSIDFSYTALDSTDSDSTMSTATAIDIEDKLITDSFTGSTDIDYYSLAVTSGNIYKFQSYSNDFDYRTLDSSGEVLSEGTSTEYGSLYYAATSDGTIYLEAAPYADGDYAVYSYAFSAEEITDIGSISADGTWNDISIANNEALYYAISATAGNTYSISFDDEYDGTGAYTADVWVSVFDNSTEYYVEEDSGYTSPLIVTAVEDTLFIEVNGDWGGGTVGLMVEESTYGTETLAADGVWTEITVIEDLTAYYTVSVTAGQTYSLTCDDSYYGSESYTGYINVSVYDDTTEYYTDIYDGYYSPLVFTPTESTITIEVFGVNSGTAAILLEESTYGTETITADGSWTELTVVSGQTASYTVNVTADQTYSLTWDDYYYGSGSYTGYIFVSVSDSTTEYFTDEYNGYYTPLIFTPTEGTITIDVYGSNSGSAGIMLEEYTYGGETITADGSWTSIGVLAGYTAYYTVDITPGQEYSLTWDDYYSGSGSYSGEISVSVYDSTTSFYTDQNSGYYTPATFTSTESSITIEVNGTSDGTAGIMLAAVTEIVSSGGGVIVADGTWNDGTVVYGDTVTYTFAVVPGQIYNVYWDDSYSGSGSYTGDVSVSIYDDSSTYASSQDSGYNSSVTVTPTTGIYTVTIDVIGYYSGGTFGIMVYTDGAY